MARRFTFALMSMVGAICLSSTTYGASQFESWWRKYEAANDALLQTKQVKQAVFHSYGLLKLKGYCQGGNHFEPDRIIEDPGKSSCCADFPDYSLGHAIVESGTRVRWHPKIDLRTKELIWQTLANEVLGGHEDRAKESIRMATRENARQKVEACVRILHRRYPD